MKKKMIIAAYVYPAWHISTYRERLGSRWTEWELLKSAKPLFPNHTITEKPLWGYYNDKDPVFVKKQINTAIEHNISKLIFNYYWDNEPVLNEGIDQGFLKAKNNEKIDFALMLSPRLPRIRMPLPVNLSDDQERIKRTVNFNSKKFLKFIKFATKKYFLRKNYFKINNSPVLYLFQYYKFIEKLGGKKESELTFKAINKFLIKKGFNGLYAIGTSDYLNEVENLDKSCFKAITSYNLLGNYQSGPPLQDYSKMTKKRIREWNIFHKKSKIPYFPSVSLGFDASCRGEYGRLMPKKLDGGRYYPWYPIIINFKLKSFELALKKAGKFIKKNNINPPIIHISSWNEWTEGNHLEPGEKSGFTYLKMVKKISKSF